MAETLLNISQDGLSLNDYKVAYTNGYLKFESKINTGILSYVNGELYGQYWYCSNLSRLELPNVRQIFGSIFSGFSISCIREIYAPKLRYFGSENFSLNGEYITSLYIPEIEVLSNINYSQRFRGFDNLSIINYSHLTMIVGNVFTLQTMSQLTGIYLPELVYMSSGQNQQFLNNSCIEYIRFPKLGNVPGNGFIFYNLPNLQNLELPLINHLPELSGLPKLKSLALYNIYSTDYYSTLFFSGSFNELSVLLFPNIYEMHTFNLGLSLLTNSDVKLIAPKLERFGFCEASLPFKSVTFPAMTEFSDYNVLYSGSRLGSRYYDLKVINLPNVSVIHKNNYLISGSATGYIYPRELLDLTFSIPLCETINTDAFNFSMLGTNNDIYMDDLQRIGLGILKISTPNLKNLESYAFKNCACLKEINLGQVSVLNEGVFYNCVGGFDTEWVGSSQCYKFVSALTLTGVNNIKEVKSYAFNHTSLATDTLYLPNCEKFDFNQYHMSNSSSIYYTYMELITWSWSSSIFYPGDEPKVRKTLPHLKLPKLSEVLITIPFNRLAFRLGIAAGSSEVRLDTCKNITINDLRTSFSDTFVGYSDQSLFRTNTLYIPECLSIEYITNLSGSERIWMTVSNLYAPKLTTITKFGFINLRSIVYNSGYNVFNNTTQLYYFTDENYIYSDIALNESIECDVLISRHGSLQNGIYINDIRFPNLIGGFEIYTGSLYSSYAFLSNNVNVVLGSINKLKIPATVSSNANLNLSIGTSQISCWYDEYFITPFSSECNTKLYLNELLNYSVSCSRSLMAQSSYEFTIIASGKIGLYSAPKLSNVYMNWIPSSAMSNTWSEINITNAILATEVYLPNLTTISTTLSSTISHTIIPKIRIFNCTSLTLGISDPNLLANNQFGMMSYLSLSQLAYIPSYPDWRGAYVNAINAEIINLNSVSYIGENGLLIDKVKELYLPELQTVDESGIGAAYGYPEVSYISLPKIKSLPDNIFRTCYNVSIMTLPSTCSKIGHYALPEELKLLRIEYEGLVDIGGGNFWDDCVVQVPMDYLSNYRANSSWAEYVDEYGVTIIGY